MTPTGLEPGAEYAGETPNSEMGAAKSDAFDEKLVVEIQPVAFKLADAANYLGIGRTSLRSYREAGLIKTVQIGGNPKYLRKGLDRLVLKLERGER